MSGNTLGGKTMSDRMRRVYFTRTTV